MNKEQFQHLYAQLPPEVKTSQAKAGRFLGRNAYTISGYNTGREPVPVEIGNLLRCMVALHQRGLLVPMLPHMEQKESLTTV